MFRKKKINKQEKQAAMGINNPIRIYLYTRDGLSCAIQWMTSKVNDLGGFKQSGRIERDMMEDSHL